MLPRRTLRIYAGPNPDQLDHLQAVHINDRTRPTLIDSEGFYGQLQVYLRDPSTAATAEPYRDTNWSDFDSNLFTVQLVGHFKPTPQDYYPPPPSTYHAVAAVNKVVTAPLPPIAAARSAWTMDDVLLGVELDRPIPIASIGLPHWILSALFRLLQRTDGAVGIDRFIENQAGDFQTNRKPTIVTPVVCAANVMNAWTEEERTPSRVSSVPFATQTADSYRASHQYQWEQDRMKAVHTRFLAHPLHGTPLLCEYNAWMWYGFQPVLGNLDPCSRRALLRPSTAKHNEMSAQDAFTASLTTQTPSLPGSFDVELARSRRRTDHAFHADPNITYAFEFGTDYFDPSTFILRPTFAHRGPEAMQVQYGQGYARSLASLLSGSPLIQTLTKRWSFDVSRVTQDARGVSRVWLVCKSRPYGVTQRPIYFWAVLFELIEEQTPFGF